MAIMVGFGADWSYDLFDEDSKIYKATPIKGVHCRKDASDREAFMVWFKNNVRDFIAEWKKECPHQYDNVKGWIGDAFANELCMMNFSDYYKDTYGQRPHLPSWYYVHAVGLPMSEDVSRMFCASPIENAIRDAKEMRMITAE